MAVKMIEDAERDGRLKPGGTIIEGTSGNTGHGPGDRRGRQGLQVHLHDDRQAVEGKSRRAHAPSAPRSSSARPNVDPEDPRSYYSVSSRLERDTPNAWKANQYDNLSNSQAHYEQTGPEIWEQTDGRSRTSSSGVGTGGTICGVGRFLKEKNPNIKVWGIDTYGSVFKKYKETGIFDKNEIYPYITEGIGEDFLPKNVDFSRHRPLREGHRQGRRDHDAAHHARGRDLRRQLGRRGDGGPAAAARTTSRRSDVVVVIFHDHGTRYLGKMFNDDWMREKGFLEKTGPHRAGPRRITRSARRSSRSSSTDTVTRAIQVMTEHDYSQIPVTDRRAHRRIDQRDAAVLGDRARART